MIGKKTLLSINVVLFFIFIVSCKNDALNDSFTEDTPTVSDNSNKTYLEIKNTSQYDVNIYFNSNLENHFIQVASGETKKDEVDIENVGKKIYIEYEYNINGVKIPYFSLNNSGCVKTIPLRKNEVNTLEVSKLDSLSFDKKIYLIIQNKTTDYVYIEEVLGEDAKELYQNCSEDSWINPKSNVVYDITNVDLKNCYIVNGNTNLNLDLGTLKSGRVYSAIYDGNGISIISLDLGINPKNDLGLPIYAISNVEDLKNILKYDDVDATFELTQDIDGAGATWKPISTFSGTLHGNNFSIKNFNIYSCSALGTEEVCVGGHFPEYCRPAFCGFFYENNGKLNDIYFKDIIVNATFEYQTDDWRYVYVGALAGRNSGEIRNVHLENIIVSSVLNHQKDLNGTPHQVNFTGGFFGKNYGKMSYCSIKNSNIKASTSAKKNRCDSSTYVGGLCGEFSSVVDNILAISTFVSAHSEGGYMKGWLSEESEIGDGILRSYAGNLFGKGYANAIYRIVSYKCDSQATTKKISNDPTEEKKTGWLSAVGELKKNEVFSFGNLEDLENSPITEWDNWSIQDGNPKNDVD